ncbi:hypothetical protein GMES_1820 [Paraglaciecola mesophila KMM 241]|uniref:Uncharacterized protein n=1 Tax=Paraglaciecola mesophila KMM 241 TaxID=1128912 RepID=K6YJE3_9ALTE|nr:hypothetical protein GMES_1820 [Paraglaciecola mesophila KMM 241]
MLITSNCTLKHCEYEESQDNNLKHILLGYLKHMQIRDGNTLTVCS